MDKHVLRRWRNGFGAHIYGQAIVVLIQLVGVPVLLHYWGAQLYGEWLILSAIPTYLSMTDLGFSQSAANDMTQRVARGDAEGALGVFQSLGVLVFGVAILGMMILLALVAVLPISRWMHLKVLTTTDVRWVLVLLAAEVLVRLTEGVSHAGYRANGDYAIHVGIQYSTLLVQSVLVWLTAASGSGPVLAAAAILLVRILAAPAVALLLIRRHPSLSFGIARAQPAYLRLLIKPAVANVTMPFAQALNLQGMVLAVGGALGPIVVVTFSTLRTLTRLTVQAVMTVSQAAEPEFAAAYGSGDDSLLGDLFVHALRAGLWLAIAAALVLVVTGGPILDFWTRGNVAMDGALFGWLLVSAVLSAPWFTALTVLKSANRHVRAAAVYALAASISVVFAATALQLTGQVAFAGMALVFTDLAMILYAMPAAAKLCAASSVGRLAAALNPLPLLTLLERSAHG